MVYKGIQLNTPVNVPGESVTVEYFEIGKIYLDALENILAITLHGYENETAKDSGGQVYLKEIVHYQPGESPPFDINVSDMLVLNTSGAYVLKNIIDDITANITSSIQHSIDFTASTIIST